MNKLQLTPAATVVTNEQGIILRSDLGTFQLHGRDIAVFIERLMPLLKGQYDLTQICQHLDDYDDNSIRSLLKLLTDKGLVEVVADKNVLSDCQPEWRAQQRFLKSFSKGGRSAPDSLDDKKVLVIGLEPWAMSVVGELARAGVGRMHLLDSGVIGEEDRLCLRALDEDQTGQPRGAAYARQLAVEAPWCEVTQAELAMNAQGLLQHADAETWDLVIVLLANDEHYWLHSIASYVQRRSLPTLYGSLDGVESWVGPLVRPGESACWNCLRLRHLGNTELPGLDHQLQENALRHTPASRARSLVAPLASISGSYIALEALRVLTRFADSALLNAVNVHHLLKGESHHHQIVPMPWCEVCGGAGKLADSMQLLPQWAQHQPAPGAQYAAMSAVSATGGATQQNPLNKVASTAMVRELFAGWVDEKFGVIKQLKGHNEQLPALPLTASAYVAAYSEGAFDYRTQGQVGAGKGLDEVSAQIGAIGEALERYSAARYRRQDMRYCAMADLDGELIDPKDLVLYSKQQYQSAGFPFTPWNRKKKIHWVRGQWLGTDQPVWVPSLVTYFNFDCPKKELFSQVSSNGLAAGQDFNDAAIRATYELIERDAMMLTWYAQLPAQRIRLDTVTDPKLLEVIGHIHNFGVALELYLLDVGTGIPTIVCLGLGDGVNNPATSVSLATHADIHTALRKAILEQGHVLPYLRSLMPGAHLWPREVSQVRSLEDHARYYFARDKQQHFDFMRQPESRAIGLDQWQGASIETIDDMRAILERAGIKVAVVDVTSPDVALSPFTVVRAVGPHLQPINFGEQFKRVDNPRLQALLNGRPANPQPHPIA
ncbi:MAG: TOMM precursor leader peptide-binding protein [Wenzhouxiangellaceae bacterium]